MSDYRKNKKLLGAQASMEIWAGLDEWLRQHPGKSQTDFVLLACVEKLQKEGIRIDPDTALRDHRLRYPAHSPSHYVMSEPSSTAGASLAEGLKNSLKRKRPKKK